MNTFLAGFRNWKTTILGGLAFLTSLAMNSDKLALGNPQEKVNVVMAALALLAGGFFAKDADKTGVLSTNDKKDETVK